MTRNSCLWHAYDNWVWLNVCDKAAKRFASSNNNSDHSASGLQLFLDYTLVIIRDSANTLLCYYENIYKTGLILIKLWGNVRISPLGNLVKLGSGRMHMFVKAKKNLLSRKRSHRQTLVNNKNIDLSKLILLIELNWVRIQIFVWRQHCE